MQHSWKRIDFFNHACIKCGCEKIKQAVNYPCKIVYRLDGIEHDRAGSCDERFTEKRLSPAGKNELLLF